MAAPLVLSVVLLALSSPPAIAARTLQQTAVPSLVSQLAAQLDTLIAIEKVAGGEGGWQDATKACSAKGVFCDESGWVTAIDLEGAADGQLPSGKLLAALPRLTGVTFHDGFTGSLPADWGYVTQLVEIKITDCGISGAIPATWAGLKNLKSLDLSNNDLGGTLTPAFGYGWSKLERLVIRNNIITGPLPAEFGGMKSLRAFYANNNWLSGTLAPWLGTAWPLLQELTLDHNELEGQLPADWDKLYAIQLLTLGSNNLEGTVPASWDALGDTLRQLDLSNNAGLTGGLPKSLQSSRIWKSCSGTALNC